MLTNELSLLAWVSIGLTLITGGVAAAFIAAGGTEGTMAGLGEIVLGRS